MLKTIMIAGSLGLALLYGTAPADAACGKICQQKCADTAAEVGSSVELCIKKWSYINARYGAQASQFEGRGGRWNQSLCRRQCRIGYKVARYSSVEACIAGIPCSKFDKE